MTAESVESVGADQMFDLTGEDLADLVADATHAMNCCAGSEYSEALRRARATLTDAGITIPDW